MRKALGLACASVDKLGTCRNSTCEHLYKGKLAVLWILQRLEGKRNRALVIRGNIKLLAVDQRNAAKVRHSWEPAINSIKQGDDALFANARTGEDRNKNALHKGLTQQAFKLFLRNFPALKVAHHQFVVCLNNQLGQGGASSLGLCLELGRNIGDFRLTVYQLTSLLMDNVNDARECLSGTHWNGYCSKRGAKTVLEHGHCGLIVCIRAVQAVDKQCAAERQVLGSKPKPGGYSARSTSCINNKQRSLNSAHCRIGVTHKVRIARCVKHVNACIFPGNWCDSSRDRESAL